MSSWPWITLEPAGLLQNQIFCFVTFNTSYNEPLQHITKLHVQHQILRCAFLGAGQAALGVSQMANISRQIISIGLCGSSDGLQSNRQCTNNREQQGRESTALSGNPQGITKPWKWVGNSAVRSLAGVFANNTDII